MSPFFHRPARFPALTMRPRWRKALIAFGLLLALAVGLKIAGAVYRQRDYLPYFQARKGTLVSVLETPLEETAEATTHYVELRDDRGLRVEAHVRAPRSDPGRHPAVVILGGVATGRRTLDFLGSSSAMLVAIDYPYHGPRDDLSAREFARRLPEMRQAMLDTVPATMLVLDYLSGRGDVDPDRILLAGGSFGALFAPAVAAAEPRITAVAILFGAADLPEVIRATVDYPAPRRHLVAWLGSYIVAPMEPLKYVDRISPRPLFMLNGTDDPVMPERCVRRLHGAASEPKKICWVPVGHVNVRDRQFHDQILGELTAWLVEIGFVAPEEGGSFLRIKEDGP